MQKCIIERTMTQYYDGGKQAKTRLDRFNEKYEINESTGCWLWHGSKDKDGYGKININYKNYRAHRLSYELFKDIIPEGLFVCHTCDTPNCVNPEHLFLGTNQDNMDDMVAKGRSPKQRGEDGSSTVLTEEQAQYILDFNHYHGSLTLLAKKFDVDISTVHCVKSGKSWQHLKNQNK